MIIHQVSAQGFEVEEIAPEDLRSEIYLMEECLRLTPAEDVPVEHIFAEGLYMRKIFLRKGLAITGRIHKQDDLQILISGDLTIYTEDGMKRYIGHAAFRSKAGIKPFAVANEDTHWATVHHTHLTDLDAIDKELFEQEPGAELDFITGKVIQEVLPCQAHS
jgi:hypothetical protein